MKVEALGKLRDGVVASNRGDRHLRLEGRCVIATRTFQDDLLLSRGFFAPQQVKSSHKTLFGYPGPPLWYDISGRQIRRRNHLCFDAVTFKARGATQL